MQTIAKMAVFILFFNLAVSAQATGGTGNISGSVNYCQQGGVLGMKVILSGRQASVYTANDGKFSFDGLPDGNYALFFTIQENLIHVSQDIKVQSGKTTALGEISFCAAKQTKAGQRELEAITKWVCQPESQAPECVDNDEDGVVAAKDCDDNNKHINPDAPEVCDGIDNNCNGKIDDLGVVSIENGVGICQNGTVAVKSCKKGFADCDGKPDNGCEIDIMNDNENCGECGNVCPALEICGAGFC